MLVSADYLNYQLGQRKAAIDYDQSSGVSGWSRFINELKGNSAQNAFAAQQAELERQFNSAEAAKQRKYEEYLSNSAYQRAVKDMRAAGINPATLTGLTGGASAASTPSGASASSSGVSASSAGGSIGGILSTLVGVVAAIALKRVPNLNKSITHTHVFHHNS